MNDSKEIKTETYENKEMHKIIILELTLKNINQIINNKIFKMIL